jgi:L-seryl-tRNA(Ser) seleniumtransferase
VEERDSPGPAAKLRALPPVHELAAALGGSHGLAVTAARRAVEERRGQLRAGQPADEDLLERARAHLRALEVPTLRRVINASGVIIHTNLGRAPLSSAAREAVAEAAEGYSNLELDLETGARGSRQGHVEDLLRELTGAEAALVVNNGAGAVLLAAAALAGPGRAIVVSRGQQVEIGGGFRIPEVIAQSGSDMIEVGTTNRTRLSDYQRAVRGGNLPVGAVLRVHQSNFRTLGFVEEVAVEELCSLSVPVIDDVGSGALAIGVPALGDEPDLRRSVAAGAALVCCSGDKLLGGPQAGLLAGRAGAVAAARAHPLARALRIDKLSLAALAATLRLYRDPVRARAEIPVLEMLEASEDVLMERARRLAELIGAEAVLTRTMSRAGGGALPLAEFEGPGVALVSRRPAAEISDALRANDPPVIARIHEDRVLLDTRTLADGELETVAVASRRALDV